MKKHNSIIVLLLLFFAVTLNGFSQNVTAHRKPVNKKTVPKQIINTFNNQYPTVLLLGWYSTHLSYWQEEYSSDWDNGWYGKRTVVVYTYLNPNYYEVEFIDEPGEISRAIYNLHGNWYETRTRIKGLPIDIQEAIKSSNYNGWKIQSTMEIIESPMWPGKIYRFNASKGLRSHTIRMDPEGNLIQVKKIKE